MTLNVYINGATPIAATVDLDHAQGLSKSSVTWPHGSFPDQHVAEEACLDKMHQLNRFDCTPTKCFKKAGSPASRDESEAR